MPLIFFLTVYSVIVTASSPLQIKYQHNNYYTRDSSSSRTYNSRTKSLLEEQWIKNKVVPIINIVFIFLTFVFDGVQLKSKNLLFYI